MRNPSPEAQEILTDLKSALTDFFENKSDAEIEWVLSNATESRGHFTDAKAVRDFCTGKSDPPTSTTIAAIDGLLSALSYSNVRGKIASGDEHEGMKRAIQDLFKGEPRYIGSTHETRQDALSEGRTPRGERDLRSEELKAHGAILDGEIFAAPDRAISLASGFEPKIGMNPKPKVIPSRQKFQHDAYCEAAAEMGMPLVGHISGTMPANLTVAKSLLKKFDKPPLTEERTIALAGLTAASFHRSAFHSPPEVLVGLRHFLGDEATTETVGTTVDDLKDLFSDSIIMMASAADEKIHEAVDVLVDEMKTDPLIKHDGSPSGYSGPPQVQAREDKISNWGVRMPTIQEEYDAEEHSYPEEKLEMLTSAHEELDEIGAVDERIEKMQDLKKSYQDVRDDFSVIADSGTKEEAEKESGYQSEDPPPRRRGPS